MANFSLKEFIETKLGRRLVSEEKKFLGNLERSFRRFEVAGEIFEIDLARLNPRWPVESFDPLVLWSIPPKCVIEFWNYLVYVIEKAKFHVPAFLEVVTDREWAKERMASLERSRGGADRKAKSRRVRKHTVVQKNSELSIRMFVSLAEESMKRTPMERQFEEQAYFLLRILELGKVIDARLILDSDIYRRASPKMPKSLIAHVARDEFFGANFIVMKCVDDVFLIEGSSNFSLRGFIGADRFPIPRLWRSKNGTSFDYKELRVARNLCSIYVRHCEDWLNSFKNQLRMRRIHWAGL